jgi:hypothetical protein
VPPVLFFQWRLSLTAAALAFKELRARPIRVIRRFLGFVRNHTRTLVPRCER